MWQVGIVRTQERAEQQVRQRERGRAAEWQEKVLVRCETMVWSCETRLSWVRGVRDAAVGL
eukprot:1778167-Rhodomonas_salina.1